MDQVHVIRHKVLVEGLSQRRVAQELGLSRNTVRKYVDQPEPLFRKPDPRARPVMDRVTPRLQELVEEWSRRVTKKQRITGSRLHRQLVKEGIDVGQTTVRLFFREWQRQRKEVFIPLVHRPGDEAQVDFFEVVVEIDGKRCKRWMFLMRLMYSGHDFVWLYEHCDQVAFLDGHVRAFAHFGGVPSRCIYDNLSPAVRRVLLSGRDLTQRFEALVSHYLFEPCFARVGVGHDKGGVEARGKGIRLQYLVPIPRGENLADIAAELLSGIEADATRKRDKHGRTVMDKFTEETQRLRELPEYSYEPRLVVVLSLSRKALLTYQGGVYSLPSHWKSLDVTGYVGPTDIRFVCREETVVRDRVGRHDKNIQYRDYLSELSQKPQAVRQVAPELLAELGEPFGELWQLLEATHGGREAGRIMARMLAAIVKHGEPKMQRTLAAALDAGKRELPLLTALPDTQLTEIDVPEPLRQYAIESACAADFDALLCEQVAS